MNHLMVAACTAMVFMAFGAIGGVANLLVLALLDFHARTPAAFQQRAPARPPRSSPGTAAVRRARSGARSQPGSVHAIA
jgi:hypothetical protein